MAETNQGQRRPLGRAFWLTVALLINALVVFVLVGLPLLVVQHEPGLRPSDRIAGQNGVRTAGVAALVALGSAATAVFGAHTYTLNRRSHRLAQQGQLADRYTKAIDQLGSGKSSVRIGGIYALAQTVRDEQEYGATVHLVLNSYVRDHAPWPSCAAPTKRVGALKRLRSRSVRISGNRRNRPDPPGPDVVVALAVLREIRKSPKVPPLDLCSVNLSGTDLTGMNLVDARLSMANLNGARLDDADLDGADLRGALLYDTSLYRANVTNVRLWHGQVGHAPLALAKGADHVQLSTPGSS